MLKRGAWLVLLVLTLMSGCLSIIRESVALFAPDSVPSTSLFWACLKVAVIVSFFGLWLVEFRGRKEDRITADRRLASVEADLRALELRLADQGPQIKLDLDRNAPTGHGGLYGRLLLTADKDVSDARIRPVLGDGFSLTFAPLHVIEADRARSISAELTTQHQAAAGTALNVFEEYFELTGAPLPLLIDYRDMRGNSFVVAWRMERREIEDMQGSRVHYPLRQDPDSYRYSPPTPSDQPDSRRGL